MVGRRCDFVRGCTGTKEGNLMPMWVWKEPGCHYPSHEQISKFPVGLCPPWQQLACSQRQRLVQPFRQTLGVRSKWGHHTKIKLYIWYTFIFEVCYRFHVLLKWLQGGENWQGAQQVVFPFRYQVHYKTPCVASHKSRNRGWTSADRSTRATLMLTVPRSS